MLYVDEGTSCSFGFFLFSLKRKIFLQLCLILIRDALAGNLDAQQDNGPYCYFEQMETGGRRMNKAKGYTFGMEKCMSSFLRFNGLF